MTVHYKLMLAALALFFSALLAAAARFTRLEILMGNVACVTGLLRSGQVGGLSAYSLCKVLAKSMRSARAAGSSMAAEIMIASSTIVTM